MNKMELLLFIIGVLVSLSGYYAGVNTGRYEQCQIDRDSLSEAGFESVWKLIPAPVYYSKRIFLIYATLVACIILRWILY
jgi:hypothetical protein